MHLQEKEKCLHMSHKYGFGLMPRADAAERRGWEGCAVLGVAVCQIVPQNGSLET